MREPTSEYITEVGQSKQRYFKAEKLGRGGFATVYKLIKVCAEKTVFAGKIIEKENMVQDYRKQKLEHEITIQKSLRHRNIVQLRHFFEDDQHIYILLEYCSRGTLADLVRRRGQLTEVECRYFMWQLVGAVEHMHARGIMHRDLKLSNVFLNE